MNGTYEKLGKLEKRGKGYILWYSLSQQDFDPAEVLASAQKAGVSFLSLGKVKGRNAKDSFLLSTKAVDGIPGKVVEGENYVIYRIEDLPGYSFARVLMRVSKDTKGLEIKSTQVAAFLLDETRNTVRVGFHQDFINEYPKEIIDDAEKTAKYIQLSLNRLLGGLNSSVIRGMLRDWLKSQNRVPLKKGGGVYYLPFTGDSQKDDIQKIVEFIIAPPLNGEMIVLPFDQNFSNMQQLQKSASEELMEQVKHYNTLVKEYQNKGKNGKQVRPSKIRSIKKEIADLEEMVKVVSSDLELEANTLIASISIVRKKFNTIEKTYASPDSKFAAKERQIRKGRKGSVRSRRESL